MSLILRNWHLKLGAVALATILYTGFVYSGSFSEQTFPGIAVSAINQPNGVYPLTQDLGTVDVRYRLAADAPERVTAESFAVTVDLGDYDMDQSPQTQALSVNVRSLATGVEVLDYSPTTVPVAIDRIGQKEVPVVVDRGEVPEGLAIGTPRVSQRTVVATGPESQLGRVDRALAQVQIFESGIDVQRQVTLLPVDVDGREVQSVDLEPATVTVEIDVTTVEATKTVPVRPTLTGSPAEGFEIGTVTVDPAVVTLLGLPDALAGVTEVPLEALSVAGASGSLTLDAAYALPAGTRLAGNTRDPTVSVQVTPAVATRTLLVGVICGGASGGNVCLPQQAQIAVTLEGPAAALAAIDPADVTPTVDVTGRAPGTYQLNVTVPLPDGITLVAARPSLVTVIVQPPSTPSPAPG